jgi:hypothetical protein
MLLDNKPVLHLHEWDLTGMTEPCGALPRKCLFIYRHPHNPFHPTIPCQSLMRRLRQPEELISILNAEDDRLSDISQRFSDTFSFPERISALSALTFLLTDRLLDHRQQLMAVWLLLDECKPSSPVEHPFYPLFLFLSDLAQASPNSLSPQLHDLLGCIVHGVPLPSLGTHSLKSVLSSNFVFPEFGAEGAPEPRPFPERASPVLVLPEGGGALTHSEVLLKLLQDDAYWGNFEPPFAHTSPDLSPVFKDEIGFVEPCVAPFLCDDGVPVNSRGSIVALITKAADGKLRSSETESVVARLRADPTLAEEAQIPPGKLPTLIENNQEIAKEVIVATIGKPGVQDGLLHADVSAASVDVVKHVLMSKQAPEKFLANYVRVSTTALSNIQNVQTRLRKARVFCKMMSFVIQSGEKLTSDIMLDLIGFCEDHKTKGVKEAQELNTILVSASYTK